MATPAQVRVPEPEAADTRLLSRVGWMALTVLIGVLLSLLSGWAGEMKAADRRNESDIRALEQRMGRLESGLERVEAKLDILIQRDGRRK